MQAPLFPPVDEIAGAVADRLARPDLSHVLGMVETYSESLALLSLFGIEGREAEHLFKVARRQARRDFKRQDYRIADLLHGVYWAAGAGHDEGRSRRLHAAALDIALAVATRLEGANVSLPAATPRKPRVEQMTFLDAAEEDA